MTLDLFSSFPFSDGQVILEDDLNAAQRRAMARVFDQVIAGLVPNWDATNPDPEFTGQWGANVPTGPYAYALSGGGAYPKQGSTNGKIKIAAGTLLQKLAAGDGEDEQLAAFTFDGTTELTIAAGDGANPRVDLLQMKLEYIEDTPEARDFEDAVTGAPSTQNPNTKRRTKCTVSLKQGTPGASPTYPAPDTGYVVIAGIVVGTSYAAANPLKYEDSAGANAVIHDQRMPLGRAVPSATWPQNFVFNPAKYELDGEGTYVEALAAADYLFIPYRSGSRVGRLIATRVPFLDPAALTSRFHKMSFEDGGGAIGVLTVANTMNGGYANGSGLGQFSTRRAQLANFQALHEPAAGPTVQANANGMGPPLWTNGLRCPFEPTTVPIPWTTLCLVFDAATIGSQFGPVTFYVAEGL